jgi:UDP-glucose 4-epimerase
VLEVLDSVQRVSGRRLDVRMGPRRPGDLAPVMAGTERIRGQLGWVPAFDDLDAIVATSLRWEEHLMKMGKGEEAPSTRTYALP